MLDMYPWVGLEERPLVRGRIDEVLELPNALISQGRRHLLRAAEQGLNWIIWDGGGNHLQVVIS